MHFCEGKAKLSSWWKCFYARLVVCRDGGRNIWLHRIEEVEHHWECLSKFSGPWCPVVTVSWLSFFHLSCWSMQIPVWNKCLPLLLFKIKKLDQRPHCSPSRCSVMISYLLQTFSDIPWCNVELEEEPPACFFMSKYLPQSHEHSVQQWSRGMAT
jgi:hypothetical protein